MSNKWKYDVGDSFQHGDMVVTIIDRLAHHPLYDLVADWYVCKTRDNAIYHINRELVDN
jgi:hypothetical protein